MNIDGGNHIGDGPRHRPSRQDVKRKHLSIMIAVPAGPVSDLLTTQLTKRGHYIITAPLDGTLPPDSAILESDLVLVDLDRVHTTGLELIRWVSQNRSGIPVWCLTGHREEHNLEALARAGASRCIRKPFSMRGLLHDVVEHLVEGRGPGAGQGEPVDDEPA